jgi:hypothetical protein
LAIVDGSTKYVPHPLNLRWPRWVTKSSISRGIKQHSGFQIFEDLNDPRGLLVDQYTLNRESSTMWGGCSETVRGYYLGSNVENYMKMVSIVNSTNSIGVEFKKVFK